MKIAIIGSGNIGGALAKGLDKKNHQIIIGTRKITGPDETTLAKNGQRISVDTIPNAVRQAEVVIIAVPLKAIPDLTAALGDVSGKVIIETSNAFGKGLPEYSSGTLAIKALSGNKDVVKCFNTVGSENLANPSFGR